MKNAIFLNKKIGYAALCVALLLLELFCFGKVAKFDRSTAETKEKMKALRSEAAAAYDLQLADDEKLVFWRVEAVNADNHPVGDYVKVCEKSTFGKDLAWYEDTLGYTSAFIDMQKSTDPPGGIVLAGVYCFAANFAIAIIIIEAVSEEVRMRRILSAE